MTGIIRRHPMLVFFVLAYAGSWISWSPWWLSQDGLGVLSFEPTLAMIAGINQVGLFAGPFAAALIVTRVCDGSKAVSALLDSMTKWRVRPIWFIAAVLVIPIVIATGYVATSETSVTATAGALIVAALLGTYFVYLLGGPLQEEIGWRGFALPRLQMTLHPMWAALILGVLHGFWHVPLFLTSAWDTARGNAGELVAYLALVISLSFILSWLANGSRGSILLAILGHNGVNWGLLVAARLTGEEESVPSNWPAAIGLSALAIIVIISSKGRLGVQNDRGQDRTQPKLAQDD